MKEFKTLAEMENYSSLVNLYDNNLNISINSLQGSVANFTFTQVTSEVPPLLQTNCDAMP